MILPDLCDPCSCLGMEDGQKAPLGRGRGNEYTHPQWIWDVSGGGSRLECTCTCTKNEVCMAVFVT